MERLKNFGFRVFDEIIFWGEVLGEVLGLDRNKYTDILEQKQREKEKSEELEAKRRLYQRLTD